MVNVTWSCQDNFQQISRIRLTSRPAQLRADFFLSEVRRSHDRKGTTRAARDVRAGEPPDRAARLLLVA